MKCYKDFFLLFFYISLLLNRREIGSFSTFLNSIAYICVPIRVRFPTACEGIARLIVALWIQRHHTQRLLRSSRAREQQGQPASLRIHSFIWKRWITALWDSSLLSTGEWRSALLCSVLFSSPPTLSTKRSGWLGFIFPVCICPFIDVPRRWRLSACVSSKVFPSIRLGWWRAAEAASCALLQQLPSSLWLHGRNNTERIKVFSVCSHCGCWGVCVWGGRILSSYLPPCPPPPPSYH